MTCFFANIVARLNFCFYILIVVTAVGTHVAPFQKCIELPPTDFNASLLVAWTGVTETAFKALIVHNGSALKDETLLARIECFLAFRTRLLGFLRFLFFCCFFTARHAEVIRLLELEFSNGVEHEFGQRDLTLRTGEARLMKRFFLETVDDFPSCYGFIASPTSMNDRSRVLSLFHALATYHVGRFVLEKTSFYGHITRSAFEAFGVEFLAESCHKSSGEVFFALMACFLRNAFSTQPLSIFIPERSLNHFRALVARETMWM